MNGGLRFAHMWTYRQSDTSLVLDERKIVSWNLFFSLVSRLPVVLAQEKEAHKKYVQYDLEGLDLHLKLAKHSSQLFQQKISPEI